MLQKVIEEMAWTKSSVKMNWSRHGQSVLKKYFSEAEDMSILTYTRITEETVKKHNSKHSVSRSKNSLKQRKKKL
jgi:hypothetical protein